MPPPDRPPEIRIGAERDRLSWLFEVTDNGRGFKPSDAERIFVVFERLDYGRREIPGTDLGLAICHRGSARGTDLESKPGEGSVFRFTLPADEREGLSRKGAPIPKLHPLTVPWNRTVQT